MHVLQCMTTLNMVIFSTDLSLIQSQQQNKDQSDCTLIQYYQELKKTMTTL